MSNRERPALLTDADLPRLFSIDAGRPFLADLAEGLIDALGPDLQRAEIFLPTRRALRAAGEAVLAAYERRGVGAALLPRFRAIGDIEEDELTLFAGEAADEIDALPAISPTARMVTLARFVAMRDCDFAGQANWPAAIAAARELGKLLDSFHTEEADLSALAAIDVAGAADHWKRSLDFLEVVTRVWPDYLRNIGRLDPARRRARLIDATARRIAEHPPAHPVIIAGTTASAPAVARLVAAIAGAPCGAAILPGLDRSMDARAWSLIEDAHPQAGLKALLDEMGIAPARVRPWPRSGGDDPRTRLLTLALRPAEATDEWLALVGEMTGSDSGLQTATRGLALIEADHEEAEAAIIAALFRETVEAPGRTAFLVTPDRSLSRRVALKMRRWNIIVDDSAGVPFANSACGTYLRLVAGFLEDPGDPVAILALLRHPLQRLAAPPAVDAIDRALRGARPADALQGLVARFAADGREEAHVAAGALLRVAGAFPRGADAAFAEMFDAHLAAAESLAGAALWSGDDGEAGASLLAELRASAEEVSAIGGRRYAEVFSSLIAGAAVRRRAGAHPRLAILGPLEARLQSADRIILGGLNEGVWPQDAAKDPFLSRAMRRALKLASPERRIGLSAHDFAGLAARGEVFLTRSKRAEGKPANPSRWIIRLKSILTGAGAIAAVDRSAQWGAIAAALDAPAKVEPASAPRPKAGPGRRPAEVSVTRIEKWLRDPYGIYAHYLLGLRKLDDPGVAVGAREMGMLLHRTFEAAAKSETAPTPAEIAALFDGFAPDYGFDAAALRFWSVALADSFGWFAAFDAERRAEGDVAVLEGKGAHRLAEIDPPVTLTARADRIDILKDGRAALIDYKLGRIPSEKQIERFSPQLTLTGAIVEAGGFDAIGARAVASYAYHRLVNRKDKDADNALEKTDGEASAAIREARENLIRWVRHFDDPQSVYLSQPRPEFKDDYGDYDQLARRKEWSAAEDGGEEGGE